MGKISFYISYRYCIPNVDNRQFLVFSIAVTITGLEQLRYQNRIGRIAIQTIY